MLKQAHYLLGRAVPEDIPPLKKVIKMLADCDYSQVRLLHELSRLVWYLKKHAKKDAKKAKHHKCYSAYAALQKDLGEHIDRLKKGMGKISR